MQRCSVGNHIDSVVATRFIPGQAILRTKKRCLNHAIDEINVKHIGKNGVIMKETL